MGPEQLPRPGCRLAAGLIRQPGRQRGARFAVAGGPASSSGRRGQARRPPASAIEGRERPPCTGRSGRPARRGVDGTVLRQRPALAGLRPRGAAGRWDAQAVDLAHACELFPGAGASTSRSDRSSGSVGRRPRTQPREGEPHVHRAGNCRSGHRRHRRRHAPAPRVTSAPAGVCAIRTAGAHGLGRPGSRCSASPPKGMREGFEHGGRSWAEPGGGTHRHRCRRAGLLS